MQHLNSAIYQGQVRHRRFDGEQQNRLLREFNYQVFMVYLDLQELDAVFEKSRWWSRDRFSLAWFRRKDFFDRKDTPLYEAVANLVEEQTGLKPKGAIRMLTNLRYFGFIINPITCYYCFDEAGKNVETIVAEVTNTPWKQRCHYVLPIDEQQQLTNRQAVSFSKDMHVSPFQPLNLNYQWFSQSPEKTLAIHIDVEKQADKKQQGNKVLDATLNLVRYEMTSANMQRFIWRYPWMTAKVFGAIYWQALRLFVNKYRYFPNKTKSNFTVSRRNTS